MRCDADGNHKEVNTKHHKFFINHVENRFCLTSWLPNMSCAHVHIITQSYLMHNDLLFIQCSCSDYVHMLQEFNSHIITVAPTIAPVLVDWYMPPYYCGLKNILHILDFTHARPTSCIQSFVAMQIQNVWGQFVDNLYSICVHCGSKAFSWSLMAFNIHAQCTRRRNK